jgi:hypothetical protein
MHWDGFITALATSITGMVAVMLYLLNKPRVKIISAIPIQWWYIYHNSLPHNGDITGAGMTIKLQLRNEGGTHSFCLAIFESREHIIFTGEVFELAGHGGFFDDIVSLYWSKNEMLPQPQPLKGILKIEPWGNRTFLIGRKTLTAKLTIPYGGNKQ